MAKKKNSNAPTATKLLRTATNIFTRNIARTARNNDIFGYRDSNDNNIYCVYCKILYQIYNTLSYQYIFILFSYIY